MNIDQIVELVKKRLNEIENNQTNKIPIYICDRYVHLSDYAKDILFGYDYEFKNLQKTKLSDINLTDDMVKLIGEKNVLDARIVVGSNKNRSTVEISKSEAEFLGINPVLSGPDDSENGPGILLTHKDKAIKLRAGVVITDYYLTANKEFAERHNLMDKQYVKIKINSKRPIILENVILKISEDANLALCIDSDTKNACFIDDESYGEIYE